jgi:uncharacterized membrane protein YphA (DoxX/SURF4 family)
MTITTTQIKVENQKGLHITLWVAQVVLAALFLMAGITKCITPIDQMLANAPWAKDFPWLIRFIGLSELAGGLGLILPSLLRIRPILTPLAAVGITVIMLLATILHLIQKEYSPSLFCIFIGLIAAFVTWGRLKKRPITNR